jgi:signal peptidase
MSRLVQVVRQAGFTVAILLVLTVITGSVVGQPVVLGFVTTDSMAPTLKPGDGFVAVPSALTGVEQRDVITYRAQEIQGGGLVTHRVVDVTEQGFITKGDANPFTDQDDEEPIVKREQVVAQALQADGEVVVIPHLGSAVGSVRHGVSLVQGTLADLTGLGTFLGPEGLAYLFFTTTLVYYISGLYRESATRDQRADRLSRRRTGVNPQIVLCGFAALLVVAATASMAGPAGAERLNLVSASFESERPDVVPAGESKDRIYRVPNGGLLPVHVLLEPGSDGVAVDPSELQVGSRQTVNATLTLHAPPETGYYRYYVTEHRYLAILPTSTIRTLYEVHPWLPVVVIDALIAGAFLALTLPFVGSGRIRNRSRDGARRSILTRLVR